MGIEGILKHIFLPREIPASSNENILTLGIVLTPRV